MWYEKVSAFLPADKKFLAGDQLTIYDFMVAGFMTNMLTNPNTKDPEKWAAAWEKAPDRIKQYYTDFTAEMKDYLDGRPTDCTV